MLLRDCRLGLERGGGRGGRRGGERWLCRCVSFLGGEHGKCCLIESTAKLELLQRLVSGLNKGCFH